MSMFSDWEEDWFGDWKPLFDSKIMNDNSMPLSFRRTLLQIQGAPVTINCPTEELI